MVCAPVRSIIGDYLSVQAHKPCFISHLFIEIADIPNTFPEQAYTYIR